MLIMAFQFAPSPRLSPTRDPLRAKGPFRVVDKVLLGAIERPCKGLGGLLG